MECPMDSKSMFPVPCTCDKVHDEREDRIRALAIRLHEKEGDLEIDGGAVVSEGEDNGAYVQCWKWVDFAGTELDRECNECSTSQGELDEHGICSQCRDEVAS